MWYLLLVKNFMHFLTFIYNYMFYFFFIVASLGNTIEKSNVITIEEEVEMLVFPAVDPNTAFGLTSQFA